MIKVAIGMAAITAAGSALATPVTLECTRPTTDATEMQKMQFTLDEENSTAVIVYPASLKYPELEEMITKTKGVFTADKVVFDGYTVNRVDLTFGNNAGWGKCKIAEATKRAF